MIRPGPMHAWTFLIVTIAYKARLAEPITFIDMPVVVAAGLHLPSPFFSSKRISTVPIRSRPTIN